MDCFQTLQQYTYSWCSIYKSDENICSGEGIGLFVLDSRQRERPDIWRYMPGVLLIVFVVVDVCHVYFFFCCCFCQAKAAAEAEAKKKIEAQEAAAKMKAKAAADEVGGHFTGKFRGIFFSFWLFFFFFYENSHKRFIFFWSRGRVELFREFFSRKTCFFFYFSLFLYDQRVVEQSAWKFRGKVSHFRFSRKLTSFGALVNQLHVKYLDPTCRMVMSILQLPSLGGRQQKKRTHELYRVLTGGGKSNQKH